MTSEPIDFERLSTYLKALAHPARLEILWRLRVPASAAAVTVRPRRKDADLQPERPMSRQAILEHIEVLEGVGVVGRLPEAEGAQWVTSAQHVFALLDEMRRLTQIEPTTRVDVDATLQGGAAQAPTWPAGPKLVVAGGPWEGRVFPLAGAGPWTIGRSRSRDVALTYDPFASAENGAIHHDGSAYSLRPEPAARSPLKVNFRPVGAPHRLASGDVLGVGRSILVFQGA